MVDILTNLPRDHADWRSKFQSFKSQICHGAWKKVWCCRDGEPATESELETLQNKASMPTATSTTTLPGNSTKSS